MEKLLLNFEQTDALNKVAKNLKTDPTKETEGTYGEHLLRAYRTFGNVEEKLEEITNAIHYSLCDVEDHHYCESIKHIEKTPEIFSELKHLIKEAENELARAVEVFEDVVEKTNLKFVFSDEEFLNIVDKCESQASSFQLERRNGDIYMVFDNCDSDENETNEIRIAYNAEYDGELNLVEQYINKLLNRG